MRTSKDQSNPTSKNPYPTQHIFCAAYLLAVGHQISHVDTESSNKSTMYFEGENAERDALSFFNGTAKKIDPKKYSESYRNVKDFLFQR